jgi:pyruvate dehydrogenase complex dehydrogenase (E1) component
MNNQPTIDALQIKEWEESIDNVIEHNGVDTACFIINRIADRLRETTGERALNQTTTDYMNTIPVEKEHVYRVIKHWKQSSRQLSAGMQPPWC